MLKTQTRPIACLLIIGALCLSILPGCHSEKEVHYTVVPDDTTVYFTEDSVDAYNYTMYVNKEITLVANILETHMAIGDSIQKGKYLAEDEIDSVRSDLDMVAEAIASVETLNPPRDYEDDRSAILSRMANAESSLSAYLEALEDSDTSAVGSAVDLMEGDYIALTGAFNLMWE